MKYTKSKYNVVLNKNSNGTNIPIIHDQYNISNVKQKTINNELLNKHRSSSLMQRIPRPLMTVSTADIPVLLCAEVYTFTMSRDF